MPGSGDKLNPVDTLGAQVIMAPSIGEHAELRGVFSAACIAPDGTVRWTEEFPNTVVTVGKNLALDTFLAGSGYTVTGPYMGLISSISFATIVAADTMSSHAGWLEAGGSFAPGYTAPRKTAAWSAASGGVKTLSAALSFSITTLGTIKGAFMTYGTGALSTIDNTAGTLLSAGLFVSGDRAVQSGDVVNVSYSLSM